MLEALTQGLRGKQIANRRIRAAAVTMALAVVLALTLSRSFYDQIAINIFFSLTLAGCTIVFLSVRPLRELTQVVAAGLVFDGLQLFVLKIPFKVLPTAALLGLSSLLLLTVRRIWSSDTERQLLQDSIVPPLLFVLLGYFSSGLLALTSRLHPKTLDLFLCSFDQSLGVQLSSKLGQVVLASRWLTRTMLGVYYVLPLIILFTYARLLVRDRTLAMTAFLALLIAGPVGVVFYNLIPGCGPGYLIGAKFPFETLSAARLKQFPLEMLRVAGVRNAFPSLHLGWALLAWWYSERLSWWTRFAMAIFVIGTVFATLGLGEHYFVDLVTAFPFALMIQAACTLNVPMSNRRRSVALLTGAALMLGWVVLLRWGLVLVWMNPVIPWLLVAATVSLTVACQARLRAALFEPVHVEAVR